MADPTNQLLNDLLTIEYRSLPMYLTYAMPFKTGGEDQAVDVLRHIVTDQQHMVAKIAEELQSRGGSVDVGDFPMEFTDMHDLALQYLIKDVTSWQVRDIQRLTEIAAQLQDDRAARELAQEVLGSARAHLEALHELSAAPTA